MHSTDHSDDELPTLAEFLKSRGWTFVRTEKERGKEVGIFSKGGMTYRAGDALRVEWDGPDTEWTSSGR